jgi:hypothetical protein
MAKYQPGSNRAKVYEQLSSKPITIEEICRITGIEQKPVESVLFQIRGDAESVWDGNKIIGYVKGAGKLKPKPKPKQKRTFIKPLVEEYIEKNIGKDITLEDLIKKIKTSKAPVYKILSDICKEGRLTLVNSKPLVYHVVEKQIPLNLPTQTLIPEVPIMSNAVGHLMQMEQKVAMYEHALQQLVVLYEQQGNLLEAIGLLEPD